MEDTTPYPASKEDVVRVILLDDPDFIGAEAALKRAAANDIIERAQHAGLEPVIRKSTEETPEAVPSPKESAS